MAKKRSNLLKKKKLLESKISNGLTNLEEFTRTMSDNIDFNSFDILSITRTDAEQSYTRQYAHRKVDTQAYRIFADAIKAVPLHLFKYKLN
ncbi:hypothetical protein [Kaarinaea lacus]